MSTDDILRRGRFKAPKDSFALRYSSSIDFDRKILEADILVDMAHTIMLTETGILSKEDGAKILDALDKIRGMDYEELTRGDFEDIHVAIETRLIQMLGENVGGRMHTARSRNDEISTCLRLRLRWDLQEVMSLTIDLMKTLLLIAKEHIWTIMPGYTHCQRAQPVTLAHHLLAYFDMFQRDLERLLESYKRVSKSPLGAGALATTSFPINRQLTAELLGFEGIVENSIDAVSSRDFLLEALLCLAILGSNISRLAEELILWSTSEFGFVELPDEYTSTSSIMPQKKNPDVMEITRARCGQIFGDLMSCLSIIKALPLTYNRDLQQLTPNAWRAIDNVKEILVILRKVLEKAKFNEDKMAKATYESFVTATDLADMLVREKGIPFRTAHTIVGALILEAMEKELGLDQIDSKLLDMISVRVYGKPLAVDNDKIKDALDPRKSVERRKVVGGPSPEIVEKALKRREEVLEKLSSEVSKIKQREIEVKGKLSEYIQKVKEKR